MHICGYVDVYEKIPGYVLERPIRDRLEGALPFM